MIKRRKRYKNQFSRSARKVIKSIMRPNTMVLYIVWIVAIVAGILILNIRSRIYNSSYLISKVVFTTWSVSVYNDSELFSQIVSIYSWSYYSTLRIGGSVTSTIDDLIQNVTYVRSIETSSFANNTLLVRVVFKEPLLKFSYKEKEYGIYNNAFIPLSTWDTLGQQTPIILLPLYLSGMSENISWILYNISVQKMLNDYLILQTSPIKWSITYIPGGEKYVIWNPNQQVYFNTKKDISKQLSLLYILKNNYNGFEDLKQIDVWSLDNPIVK